MTRKKSTFFYRNGLSIVVLILKEDVDREPRAHPGSPWPVTFT